MSRTRAGLRRLQATIVRLMVDPDSVVQLYEGRLAGLSAEDAALLRAVDPRAWATDTFRRARLLQAIVDELPVSVAVLGLQQADAYLSSEAFAQAVRERGSMVLGFGAWARRGAGDVATLERAIALARRRLAPPGPGLLCAPGVVAVDVARGTLAFVHAGRAALEAGEEGVTHAVIQGARLGPAPRGGGEEHLLVIADGSGATTVELASKALVGLLRACAAPVSRRDAERAAKRLGAGAEAAEIVAGLVEDGLLVERPG